MRPSVRAEKYIRDASACRKVVTDGNDNGTDGQTDGQTDRETDRQSATQYAGMRPPPREEGRIIRHFQHHRNFSLSTRSSAQTLSVCLKKNKNLTIKETHHYFMLMLLYQ